MSLKKYIKNNLLIYYYFFSYIFLLTFSGPNMALLLKSLIFQCWDFFNTIQLSFFTVRNPFSQSFKHMQGKMIWFWEVFDWEGQNYEL